jgi:hypothetical protein
MLRIAQTDGPRELRMLHEVVSALQEKDVDRALTAAGNNAISAHYRIWGKPGDSLNVNTLYESFEKFARNHSVMSDFSEVLMWAVEESRIGGEAPQLPFDCPLELHAKYGSNEIKASLGKATLQGAGERGVGVLHFTALRAYVLLVTFQKTEREFSPSTMYADYPISRDLLHWESQSNTTQASNTGQNLIEHIERGYTILIFVRDVKKRDGITVPYTYLGPAEKVSYQNERPIQFVWRLKHQMPAEIFEENRRGG